MIDQFFQWKKEKKIPELDPSPGYDFFLSRVGCGARWWMAAQRIHPTGQTTRSLSSTQTRRGTRKAERSKGQEKKAGRRLGHSWDQDGRAKKPAPVGSAGSRRGPCGNFAYVSYLPALCSLGRLTILV
jgi:hypothetical protein